MLLLFLQKIGMASKILDNRIQQETLLLALPNSTRKVSLPFTHRIHTMQQIGFRLTTFTSPTFQQQYSKNIGIFVHRTARVRVTNIHAYLKWPVYLICESMRIYPLVYHRPCSVSIDIRPVCFVMLSFYFYYMSSIEGPPQWRYQ